MKKIIYFFISISFCSCTKKTEQEDIINSTTASNLTNVNCSVLDKNIFYKQILANGKIEAHQRSELRFKTNEQLANLYYNNGQTVFKGEIIANLENSLLKNSLDKAQIEYDKAKNKFKEEKINFGYGKANENEIPENILKTIQFKSGYLEAKNNLENAEILYNQTILRAPFSGIIANLNSKFGNFISSSDIFCTLISQNNLEVIFNILENEMSFVKKGQNITLTSFANNAQEFNAKITEVNPAISKEGFVRVKAKITSNSQNLFDGMNVKIIINNTLEKSIVIPKEALVLRSNKEVVFTIENGFAKWNYVKIVDENSSHYAINEGLSIGDTIIISGNQNLTHDTKVKKTFIRSK